MYELEIEGKDKIFIPKHSNLLELDDYSILLLWGGRFGAKSEDIARMLVFKCLMLPKFKCVLARKVFNTVQDSSWQTIKDFVYSKGLEQFFKFTKSPLKIECTNGNTFLCRGFDKPEKIKSIKDPTHFWYEELAEGDELDFETAITTLRGIDQTQFIGSFNPESEKPKNEWWLYQKFFNRPEKDFEDIITIPLENKEVELKVKSIHTTYPDNPYLNDKQRAIVENYKREYELTGSKRSEYYYLVWTLGEFGDKLPDMPYLHEFSKVHHVHRLQYDSDYGIHITLDKNVNPYLPSSIWQYKDGSFFQLKEIILKHPYNRTHIMGKEIVKILQRYNYTGRVCIYGDSTARNDDTNMQLGTNFYTIIRDEISQYYNVEMRVPGMRTNKMLDVKRPRKNPNSRNAGDFVNDLLKTKRILVNKNCIYSISDYTQAKQDPDGGIDKREKDKATGGQKWGHLIDCLKYLCCEVLYDEYSPYIRSRKRLL
jgi:hypothetical protein